MKLKKLTITGFKSFAERVTIDFDFEIIGIVGPNGCGKSNIVDAFRWVMGEQSAKSLRGDKMHDVLFAGTDKRKPLNYAEVSVWLTDINGELPLPYDEITITRRLNRSGESEYLINKEPARLKDIQSLLLGSGMGKNAFSIFEQGKLDQIIHLSPLERRVVFDEAAGTSRFLQRKKESVKKLAAVSENYLRVRDIHAEIERQARQLKKQANQAQSYQQSRNRLEFLEKEVLLVRWKELASKCGDLTGKLAQLNDSFQEKTKEIQVEEASSDASRQRVEEQEVLARAHQQENNRLETKARVLEAEINQQKHRLLEAKKREEKVRNNLNELIEERAALTQEKARKSERLVVENRAKDLKEKELFQQRGAHQAVEKEVQKSQELIKKLQADRLKLLQEEGKIQAKIQEKQFRYDARVARLQILHALEKTHEGTEKALEQQIVLQKGKVEALTYQIDGLKRDLKKGESELQRLRKELSDGQKEAQTLSRRITEVESQQKALLRLQEDMEGFSPAAKGLLREAKLEKSELYGKIEPLFAHLVAHKGFEELMASAMKPYAETLIVERESDLELLLGFAKRKKMFGFSVLVRERVETSKGALQKNALAAHVEKNAIALHLTKNTVVADDGHFYDALGVFFHGESGKRLSNPFQRQAELKSLSEELAGLAAESEKQLSHQEKLAEGVKIAEKLRVDSSEAHRKKEMDLIQENFRLQQALADAEKLRREIASVAKERRELEPLQEEENEMEELKASGQSMKEKIQQMVNAIQEHESAIDGDQKRVKEQWQSVQSCESSFYEVRNQWQNCRQEVEILAAKMEQNLGLEKKLAQEIEELGSHSESVFEALKRHEKEIEQATIGLKGFQNAMKEQEKTLLGAKKIAEGIELELSKKRKAIGGLEKETHGLDIILAQLSSEKRGVEAELLERHGIGAEKADQMKVELETSLEEAMQEIHRLRLSVESAGAVNLTAIEEFQQAQERFDFLDQQLKDLDESKKDLEKMIQTLDQESRKIFKKTFEQIRQNFQKNFSILFTGGFADLTFTESSDILEAGIEIVAKPPGKQMRAISLLSGGEKCLTALALLFSIFEVRPAPFCILDEVDAPLDDTNIDRFTNVLKQFIDKTQFIIVTHNKKTMSIADLLIGVSMEEKGVSRLISLAFEQAKRPVALL